MIPVHSTSISLANRVWQNLEAFLNNQAPGSPLPDVRYTIMVSLCTNMGGVLSYNFTIRGYRR